MGAREMYDSLHRYVLDTDVWFNQRVHYTSMAATHVIVCRAFFLQINLYRFEQTVVA